MAESMQKLEITHSEKQNPIYQTNDHTSNEHIFDVQLKRLLAEGKVKLANYEYALSRDMIIMANGNSCEGTIFISNAYDFLWTNMEIHAYSNEGNLFGLTHSSLPPDRFVMQIKRVDGEDFFSEAIDIGRFNPMKMQNSAGNIKPTVIPANTQLRITIQHLRAVNDAAFRALAQNDDLAGFPVYFQIIMSGARLSPQSNNR